MGKSLLVIIDFQNAFINKNTIKAKEEIPQLLRDNKFDEILFTRFINSEQNPVCLKLDWNKCIDDKSAKICMDTAGYKIIDKTTYTALNNEMCKFLEKEEIDTIYLCGIDVECCVLATALNMFENNYDVRVLEDYVYCMCGEDEKKNAIEILKRNIGKQNVI